MLRENRANLFSVIFLAINPFFTPFSNEYSHVGKHLFPAWEKIFPRREIYFCRNQIPFF